ncbi:MAG: FkbM family methyltransferase [Qingshengfaniella sp.]
MSIMTPSATANTGATPVPSQNVKTITAFNRDIKFHLPKQDDHIQMIVRQSGKFYEQKMLIELTALLPENPTIVDIGANIGNHSLFFAMIAEAKVISIEPNPVAFDLLKANIDLNQLGDRVELNQLALGAATGRGAIRNVSDQNLGMAQVLSTPDGDIAISTLDKVIGDRHVDLLKIDVEGMEAEVLRGAESVLSRCHPIVIAEAATLEELAAIEALLRIHGYRKVRRYNDTPTYLFQKSVECLDQAKPMTENLLATVRETLPRTTGIYAGMATVAGNETAMRAAVMSLLPQVDGLFVYLNGFTEVPEFLTRFDKIHCHIDPEGTQYGDAGKFWGLEQVKEAVYLTCDDDMIYPVDFTERMVQELAQTNGRGIVCVHGSVLVQPMDSYYGKNARNVIHFAHELVRRRRIHVPATSACAFHSSTVCMKLTDFAHRNMADIWLTKYAEEHDIPRYCVPRRSAWLVPLNVDRPTIWEESTTETGSTFDTSQMQNTVLRPLLPLSLATGQNACPVVLLSLENDEHIDVALDGLRPGGRDPVILLICNEITEKIKLTASKNKTPWEIHLVSRKMALPDVYKELLRHAQTEVEFWSVKNQQVRRDLDEASVSAWVERAFTQKSA